ncbi:MAG: DEAD/DEAH box helicase [bacterium]
MLRKLINRVRKTLRGNRAEEPVVSLAAPVVEKQPERPGSRSDDHSRGARRGPPESHGSRDHRGAEHRDSRDRRGPPERSRNDRRSEPGARPEPQRQRGRAVGDAQHNVPRHEGWTVDSFKVVPAEGKTRFQDLSLPSELLHAAADLGFKYCTSVQAGTLPPALAGKDVAGQAQTGSGKTAAFLMAVFARFLTGQKPGDRKHGAPRALILAPTRELVVQILDDAQNLGKYTGFTSMAVFGGMDYKLQQDTLIHKRVDVLAATPGRLLDFKRRGHLDLQSVEVLILDEADRMLDMGFIPDVKTIIQYLPPREKRQTMLFSATLSPDVLKLASQWQVNPEKVVVEPDKVTVDTVDQLIYAIRSEDKFPLLANLLKQKALTRVMVFVNRRDVGAQVVDDLKACGISCGLLSGAMPQDKRMKTLDGFRDGRISIVVATDVAARGIHVDDVSHVINYDVPYEPEDYVHRIGRTARVGKNGTAIMFACEREAFTIPDIEKYIGRKIQCSVPEEALVKPPQGMPVQHARRAVRPFPGRQGGGFRGGSSRGGQRGGPARGGNRGRR